MRGIKQLVINAKNGDLKSKDTLFEYYKPFFIEHIRKKYGKDFIDLANEDYEEVFNYYFDKNVKDKIDSYFRKKAMRIYNSSLKEENLISKVSNRSEENIVYLSNYYKRKIIDDIYQKNFNYLSYEEVNKYAYDILYNFFNKYVGSDNPTNILSMIAALIARERKYLSDCESFFIKYLIYEKPNDKIIDYFTNKYLYIIEKYKNTKYGYYMLLYYKESIKVILNEINCPNFAFETKLKKKIYKKKEQLKEEIRLLQQKQDLSSDDIKTLYLCHEYVKDFVFDKYKDKFSHDIKYIISKKYDEFLNAYLNSNRNRDLSSYLFTRYTDYLDRKIKSNQICNIDINYDELNDKIYKYYHIYENILNKSTGYYPKEQVLYETYLKLCENYFKKERKSSFNSYVNSGMIVSIKYYDNLYTENYLDKTINSVLEKNIIPNDISREYFNELKKYYIEKEIYRQYFFDKYLYNEIRNFNYYDYLDIRKVKNYYVDGLCSKGKKGGYRSI